ncbi:MAG: phage major capsid protein [Cyanobacteria bacterium P01_A01_bin.40]
MTQELLIRSEGDYFLVPDQNNQTRQIPKINRRDITLDKKALVSDDRKIDLSVSSDTPYKRWWYYEILDHTKDAVTLDRMNDSAMNLFNHNRNDYLGVIEKAWLEDGKLYNTVRFGTHQRAEEIVKAINEGIMKNVSIGYRVDELVLFKKSDDDLNTYKATKWTPFESSFVTVPADATVGVGRSYYDLAPAIENKPKKGENSEEERTRADDRRKGTRDEKNADTVSGDKSMSGENGTAVAGTFHETSVHENDIRAQERERIAVITAQGKKYGCPEIAEKAINDGISVENARSLMADKVLGGSEESQNPIARTLAPVDMGVNDAKKYSILKAIGFKAGIVSAKDAGLEIEVSDHMQETRMSGKAPEGIYVDTARLVSREGIRNINDFYRAPLETGVPAAAGDLISTDLLASRFIGYLYNNSAFLPLGVTYMRDLTANLKIPRMMTAPKGYWVGEGNNIPEDNLTVDTIGLDPKKLAVFSACTFEMIQQSSLDVEQLMRNAIIAGMALELDRTIGFGTGIGEEPLGIVSTPGVNSIALGANGGPLDWASVVDMQTLISAGNAMMGRFGYVFNSLSKGKLMKTLDHTTGSGSWIWQSTDNELEGRVAGRRARESNQIPNNLVKGTATNLTAGFFGNFAQIFLGFWSGLDIIVDPYTQAKQAIINIVAKQLCDVELSRGEYFTVATDIQNN